MTIVHRSWKNLVILLINTCLMIQLIIANSEALMGWHVRMIWTLYTTQSNPLKIVLCTCYKFSYIKMVKLAFILKSCGLIRQFSNDLPWGMEIKEKTSRQKNFCTFALFSLKKIRKKRKGFILLCQWKTHTYSQKLKSKFIFFFYRKGSLSSEV